MAFFVQLPAQNKSTNEFKESFLLTTSARHYTELLTGVEYGVPRPFQSAAYLCRRLRRISASPPRPSRLIVAGSGIIGVTEA